MKIAGTGYVELSNRVLLIKNNEIVHLISYLKVKGKY